VPPVARTEWPNAPALRCLRAGPATGANVTQYRIQVRPVAGLTQRPSGRGGCCYRANGTVRASGAPDGRRPRLRSPCLEARRGGDSGEDTTAGMPGKAPSGPRAASGAGRRHGPSVGPRGGSAAKLRAFVSRPPASSPVRATASPTRIWRCLACQRLRGFPLEPLLPPRPLFVAAMFALPVVGDSRWKAH
jgi:hypothetical protein